MTPAYKLYIIFGRFFLIALPINPSLPIKWICSFFLLPIFPAIFLINILNAITSYDKEYIYKFNQIFIKEKLFILNLSLKIS